MTSIEIRRTFFDLSDKDVDDAERLALIRQIGIGKAYDWEDVLKSRVILLLSEAQSGKTYECMARQEAMWEAGEPAFFIDLSSIASQPWRELRSPDETERLDKWRRTETEIATVFLDSVDELKLTQGKFRTALANVSNDLQGHMARVRVVLTSRPLPVDRDVFTKAFAAPKSRIQRTAEDFASLAMSEVSETEKKSDVPPEVRFVSLRPLSADDVAELALKRGVDDAVAFLKGLEASSMMEFMRRPQDVIEAVSAWKELGGRFGTHAEQVAFDIKARLKPNPLREDRQLEDERALRGAKRLALAVVLTQRLTIRHDVNNDPCDASTVLDPATILSDWHDEDRKALLERGLFGFASYGRVRFHNRLAFEFLAAQRLDELLNAGMSRSAVKRLLVVQTAQGFPVIRPSLRDVAAWLASRQGWVFDFVNDLDPALLMNLGDPGSLSIEQRGKVLAAYIERFGKGGWRGLSVPQIQIHRLADAALEPIVRAQFETIENPEIRQVLLQLIGLARLRGCADLARSEIWDSKTARYEKIVALDALLALGDQEPAKIVERLSRGPDPWDHRFARSVIYRLFPQHMSVDQLLAILNWVQEDRSAGAEFSRILPTLIEGLAVERLEELRFGLTGLVEEGLDFDIETRAVKNERPHLINLLATTCALLLGARALQPADASSIVLAAELARGLRSNDAMPSKLAEAVTSASPAIRFAIFREDVVLVRKLQPDRPRLDFFMELTWRGALRLMSEDTAWIRRLIADRAASADLRASALLMEVFNFAPRTADRQAYLAGLRPLVSDDSELAAYLEERLKPVVRSREERLWTVCEIRRERQRKRRTTTNKMSWVNFWRELKDDPDTAFSQERFDNTARNLFQVMERGGARSSSSGWDRQLIEEHFGKEIADRLRNALMPLWRKEAPRLSAELPEDERSTFFARWTLALAGITAEAEDPQWAAHLTPDQAETAIRYAPKSAPSFPAWLDALAVAHPETVEHVLGGEISWILSSPVKSQDRSILLQDIFHATAVIARLFLPRIRTWLQSTGGLPRETDDVAGAADRLEQVLDILLKFGDAADLQTIGEMASAALAQGSNAPFSRVLLPALFAVDPERAVIQLEAICSDFAVSRESSAVAWFARLFGGLQRGRGVDLRRPEMTAGLLLRLLRLAYQHVIPGKDAVHEGAYSPDMRDDAETGRNLLLNAVMELGGSEGWKAKYEIANDPDFKHLSDRLHTLALDKSARESDNVVMRPDEVVKLDGRKEPAPRSPAEMFVLMIDRLDDFRDHLRADASPREMLSTVKDERVMRRAIADHLESRSLGAYSVAQESVTADEKETDIRLRSSIIEVEGVIELKIGDKKYSGADLREVISAQLVGKYLGPAGRRTGCLLITRAKRVGWLHPDTGEKLDFAGLIAMLQEAAKALQESFPDELHIDVVGLDLKPRLSTEREAREQIASSKAAVNGKPRRVRKAKSHSAPPSPSR